VAGTSRIWEWYLRWSAAIAEVVYTSAEAGRPVYLDLEDEVVAAVRDLAEPAAEDPTKALVEACVATLDFDGGAGSVLAGHLERLGRWYDGSMVGPPPSLGLLAMLSLTAERMRLSKDMRPHNFYGRFAELAGLDVPRKERFIEAYRRVDSENTPTSRRLWQSLNDWLEMHEGSRGTPTAHPLGHEHIGWALSQALVRQADRDKFVDLFAVFGLPAHGLLATSEMTGLIDEWMSRRPCPATNHLERLWGGSPLTRPRITELACLSLEQWNGEVPEGYHQANHREIDAVKVRALFRTFPARQLDVSMVIPTHARTDVEALEVLDLGGSTITTLDMVPIASGWLGVSATDEIDTGSLLGGKVQLRRAGAGTLLQRRPRRLIPLRWDDLLLSYVECERVQLGEQTLVLSRSEIAPMVNALLESAARPGFRMLERIEGLPDRWTAFEGVQILSSIPQEMLHGRLVDFYALQPLALSQVVLHGGLRLPGHLRKWHHALPPELRASSDEGGELTATLCCIRPLASPPPPEASCDGFGAALIWDLAKLQLPDGDYELEVHAGESLVDTQVLRLRSADNPVQLQGDQGDSITNDPELPGFGLLAARSLGLHAFTVAPDVLGELSKQTSPVIPAWWVERAGQTSQRATRNVVRFPEDADHSCIRTGAHHMVLPIVTSGTSSIEGICRYCGLVKAYPAKYRAFNKKRKSKTSVPVAPTLRVADLPPVRAEHSIDWRVAFDAVCHVGSGSFDAMERITAQMDSTGLFSDAFTRKLYVLGHIEIERSPTALTPIAWQVVDPTLLELETGGLALVGFRSERMMVAIEDTIRNENGTLFVDLNVNAPPLAVIHGLNRDAAMRLRAVISEAARRPTRLVWSAARALVALLPPMSQARAGLPTTSNISARSYERWDPTTAHFEPAPDAGALGAFRLSAASRTYIYRRAEDLGAMRATLGDARIVKYLAAADTGRSLIGHDEDHQILYVPLGADLPGLYGRAAVLCTGRPPIENTDKRILEYHGVPADIAARLNHLLIH